MAFDWNAYPDAGGMTGANIYLDPSLLQQPPSGMTASPAWPSGGITLQNPSPTSPMQGGGGITGGQTPQPMGGKGDPAGFQQAWFAYAQAHGGTVDSLKAFVQANPQYGATISGSKGSKITFPGGQAFQAVRSAGINGGVGPAWDDLSNSGGGGGSLGGIGSGAFVSPIGQFTPPSAADAMNSPGTQYSIDEAMRTLQNSAAAKGELLNGRVLQGELGAISNLAAGQYNDVYNRAANTFGINFGVQARNQDAPFNKYLSLAQLGQGAAAAS